MAETVAEEGAISIRDLQPGDLIFTLLPIAEGEPEDAGHVMVYSPEAGKKADIAHAIMGERASLVTKTSLPEGNYKCIGPNRQNWLQRRLE